jgi:hypothetical protein
MNKFIRVGRVTSSGFNFTRSSVIYVIDSIVLYTLFFFFFFLQNWLTKLYTIVIVLYFSFKIG